MANAGRHNDTKVLKQMIRDGKLLKVGLNDNPVLVTIKQKFNHVVINDFVSNRSINGKTYHWHSAWVSKNNTLLQVNQLRIKHWYFERVKY